MIAEDKFLQNGSRKQRRIDKCYATSLKKGFHIKKMCPCTGIRKKGFNRPVGYSDLKILELYTFFITKSHAFFKITSNERECYSIKKGHTNFKTFI